MRLCCAAQLAVCIPGFLNTVAFAQDVLFLVLLEQVHTVLDCLCLPMTPWHVKVGS